MRPEQLTAESFAAYPPQARAFAVEHLRLWQQMPLAIAPAFLREVIGYDWHFPAERRTFARQCAWLESLPGPERARLLNPFAEIRLPEELARRDWVSEPQPFLDALTASLWSTGQIDGYRRAAQALLAGPPDDAAQPVRSIFVIVGKDAVSPRPGIFRKLAPHGVRLRNLRWSADSPAELMAALGGPGDAAGEYDRWYIDGGDAWPPHDADLHDAGLHDAGVHDAGLHDAGVADGSPAVLSYTQLRPVRLDILERMNRFTREGPGGAEGMRAMLEQVDPAACGASAMTPDPRMQHFITRLFVEGSGTQIYSTSFAQWAARETLRRAQPVRMLVRFAPRQRQRTLNQLFESATAVEVPDAEGSLVDADMGAYYVLLDTLRIADPAHIVFLAWREGHGDAVIVSPRAPAGSLDEAPLTLREALARYG